MDNGYEFHADKRFLTIFSAPNYCNEFDNDGAMLEVSKDLCCRFITLKGIKKRLKMKQPLFMSSYSPKRK